MRVCEAEIGWTWGVKCPFGWDGIPHTLSTKCGDSNLVRSGWSIDVQCGELDIVVEGLACLYLGKCDIVVAS